MAFNCGDCGDIGHACMAWDGKGDSCHAEFTGTNHSLPIGMTFPNHNLKECPKRYVDCEFRLAKTPSKPLTV